MKTKLFTCTVNAFQDESLVLMPGFDWRTQPFKEKTYSYPFEQWRVKVRLHARHRSHAVRQLTRAGIADVRDLDGGVNCSLPECMAKLPDFTKIVNL